MKIESISHVKASDVPVPMRQTEVADTAQQIADKLKTAPAGQAVSFRLNGAKKWTRYALQRRLQKLVPKARITTDGRGQFWAQRGS